MEKRYMFEIITNTTDTLVDLEARLLTTILDKQVAIKTQVLRELSPQDAKPVLAPLFRLLLQQVYNLEKEAIQKISDSITTDSIVLKN